MRRATAMAACVLVIAPVCGQTGYTDVRLPGVIGSNMVLQRDQPVGGRLSIAVTTGVSALFSALRMKMIPS